MKNIVMALIALGLCGSVFAARGVMGTPGHGGFVATSTKPVTAFDPVVGPGFSVMRKGGGGRRGGGGKKFGR